MCQDPQVLLEVPLAGGGSLYLSSRGKAWCARTPRSCWRSHWLVGEPIPELQGEGLVCQDPQVLLEVPLAGGVVYT